MKAVDLTLGLTRLNDYFAEAHPLAYELKYEQLVIKPQEELEKLCAFLGITYEQGMERYGQFVDSTKSDMFYSMGVGDPFLSSHQEAHQGSVNNWKNISSGKKLNCIAVYSVRTCSTGWGTVNSYKKLKIGRESSFRQSRIRRYWSGSSNS